MGVTGYVRPGPVTDAAVVDAVVDVPVSKREFPLTVIATVDELPVVANSFGRVAVVAHGIRCVRVGWRIRGADLPRPWYCPSRLRSPSYTTPPSSAPFVTRISSCGSGVPS
jgi:hypothetical protein